MSSGNPKLICSARARTCVAWVVACVALINSAIASIVMAEPPASQPTTGPVAKVQYVHYALDAKGFSIDVPKYWQRLKQAESGQLVLELRMATTSPAVGKIATTLSVQYTESSKSSVAEIVQAMAQALSKMNPDAKVSPIEDVKLADSPAKRLTVISKMAGMPAREIYTVASHGGHIYVLALTNDPDSKPVGAWIAKNFHWTD